jgi:glycosyltransferase involved in cell wall biosynthesis
VALAHDYLNQRGGAERVALELARIFPAAPLYTSLYRPESTFPEFGAVDVRTTPLQHLPVDAGFRNLFPLYPAAWRSLGTIDADLVVSSSSGWAHAIRTSARAFHAVYCYTPARWLYGADYLRGDRRTVLLRPAEGAMRAWDRRAARRADLYIAISRQSQALIERAYGITAPIVYPPVEVDRFTPTPRGDRLLVVSRLLPYKRVDLVVAAATRAGIGLDVVGVGPALADLQAMAGPSVTFHGSASDSTVNELMAGCRAFCLPGKEDFGLTPVEALAAGKPVVAFRGGGALETVQDGVTGVFFTRQEVDDVLDAIQRCDVLDAEPALLAEAARRFSPESFAANLLAEIRRHRG